MKNLENQKIFANNINNKKSKILEYIDDYNIIYGDKKATKAEIEDATKRIEAIPKKMSKQDEYNIYFNKKSPKYYNKKKPTSPVKIDFDLKPLQTAYLGMRDIKNSSLYKLLENPKVLGVELGESGIMEVMNLINSLALKKGGRV